MDGKGGFNRMDEPKLRPIAVSDYEFLYELLEEREETTNISHRKMPSWEEHIEFVNSNPYRVWHIIICGNNKAGSFYITNDNEIGIFIKKAYQKQGIAKKVLKEYIGEWAHLEMNNPLEVNVLANINPQNEASIKLFEGLGFKHIQNTYRITL